MNAGKSALKCDHRNQSSRDNRHALYEVEKQKIPVELSPKEYERRVAKLAEKHGI